MNISLVMIMNHVSNVSPVTGFNINKRPSYARLQEYNGIGVIHCKPLMRVNKKAVNTCTLLVIIATLMLCLIRKHNTWSSVVVGIHRLGEHGNWPFFF